MIAHLRGTLLYKGARTVVVECAGVGYEAHMSLSGLTGLGEVGTQVSLFVYTHVGQDVLRLYGFVEAQEKRAFEILIGLSGVGPKLALAVLSTFNPAELREVVAAENLAALTRVPGVGKKTAQRLLFELRDRMPSSEGGAQAPATGGALRRDLVAALEDLGFARPTAEKAADGALKKAEAGAELTTLVREALRGSTQR